ncbi:hypothetical protein KM043_004303 [Ampulex compressa]|nr:hypothetical protein KM043_004303 [Ampulex compressa]
MPTGTPARRMIQAPRWERENEETGPPCEDLGTAEGPCHLQPPRTSSFVPPEDVAWNTMLAFPGVGTNRRKRERALAGRGEEGRERKRKKKEKLERKIRVLGGVREEKSTVGPLV